MLWESVARLLRKNPLALLALPFWWAGGRAQLKQQLASRVQVDPATLPYHEPLLEWLKEQKRAGRRLVLATASDMAMARPVADHVGLFDEVMASDGETNLRAHAKMDALTKRFGARGFDYAGNSAVDLDVWSGSREAVVVNASEALAQRAAQRTKVGQVFPTPGCTTEALIRGLRPHQWLKNLIVFVPVLTAHKLSEPAALGHAALAFTAFCLCACAVYVLNDLLDLDADRHHATKRNRPFAAGTLPLQFGLLAAPGLVLAAVALGSRLSAGFVGVVLLYFALAAGYSLRLKQVALLDVFVLAGLYTLRLVAGHVATGIAYSPWLLVFSMFVFLSLALLKRFLELQSLRQQNRHEAKGRGYTAADLELVTTLGLVNGYLAVLVMALYVNSDQVRGLYTHPIRLLLVCPLLLYWVSRIWFLAHRGQMPDDPVTFAVRDWVGYVIGALTLVVMWLAT